MILKEANLQFNFQDAINAFKFDEQDCSEPTFHGLSHCMKAVDFVVEYRECYCFIEVKHPPDPHRRISWKKEPLESNLVTKFRDTLLYRWAENKVDKPIHYLCLVKLDNAETIILMDLLKRKLTINKKPKRWHRTLAQSCAVTNLETWNRNYPKIQVTQLTEGSI